MKNLIKFSVLVILFSLLTASSCEKPEPPLPTGENTAYYYLDGQLIIPTGYTSGVSFVKPIRIGYCSQPNNSFTINLSNYDESTYIFFLNGIQTAGNRYLSEKSETFCESTNNIGCLQLWNPITLYYTQNNSGTVNITYLSENKRQFKGTFEMTVYNSNGIVSPHITGGHFNINLDTL